MWPRVMRGLKLRQYISILGSAKSADMPNSQGHSSWPGKSVSHNLCVSVCVSICMCSQGHSPWPGKFVLQSLCVCLYVQVKGKQLTLRPHNRGELCLMGAHRSPSENTYFALGVYIGGVTKFRKQRWSSHYNMVIKY